MEEQKNLILAMVLSLGVLLAWQYFYAGPRLEDERSRVQMRDRAAQLQRDEQSSGLTSGELPRPDAPSGQPSAYSQSGLTRPRSELISLTPRVEIRAPSLIGSINLIGARLDDLSLVEYRDTISPSSPLVTLLSPSGAPKPYYAEIGWLAARDASAAPPGPTAEWQLETGTTLAPGAPVTLRHDSSDGMTYRMKFEVDDKFLFTLTQSATNNTAAPTTLYPFGLLARHGTPEVSGFFILHEGPIGYLEDELQEYDYDDLKDDGPAIFEETKGWFGITDKYWATSLVPDKSLTYQARFQHTSAGAQDRYQTDYRAPAVEIRVGETRSLTTNVFAGAKRVRQIDAYDAQLEVENFDLLIDWGWFYFITKPLFFVIDYFSRLLGNFGLAILAATVLIKLFFFPLANRSYESMSRMKKVQPQVKEIQARYGDDRQRQQQEMMALYKREKINPLSGCLPIVLQIPVFFALYKVLFVTIEMRQAPFFGWIKDLSVADPTSVFNLFGLLPYDVPQFLILGAWPLMMGITMFVQTMMNPAPTEPTQAIIIYAMPIFFTFILASLPAGLVIYWTWNNLLSILQQGLIMRRQGVKIELGKNIRRLFRRS